MQHAHLPAGIDKYVMQHAHLPAGIDKYVMQHAHLPAGIDLTWGAACEGACDRGAEPDRTDNLGKIASADLGVVVLFVSW
jgi:hypothetical protein